jgi:hypothetical protein
MNVQYVWKVLEKLPEPFHVAIAFTINAFKNGLLIEVHIPVPYVNSHQQ